MKVLGIAGALRAASLNRKLLAEAARLAPAGLVLEVAEFRGIPVFDEDEEAQGMPEAAAALRAKLEAADALLIATPEYNHGVPGGLKNAIDWLSRRVGGRQPFAGKPCGTMGATQGTGGTIMAQAALRPSLQLLGARVMYSPGVYVSGAGGKFGEDGRLTDAATEKALAGYMAAFAEWTERMKD